MSETTPAELRRPTLHRDLHAGRYVDLFLVAAISAVLGIRFYLHLAGYPTVGGEALHIAHVLWGGLLMLVAILLAISFLGRRSRAWAALLGGLGFGTFVDEIGKFVTHDNDYFYRPAVALIYITFVLTYVAARTVHGRRATREEYIVNALQEMEQVVIDDLQAEERERALAHLRASSTGASDRFAEGLAVLLREAETRPSPRPGALRRLHRAAVERYRRLTTHPSFTRGLVAFFVLQLAAKLLQVLWLAVDPGTPRTVSASIAIFADPVGPYAIAEWLQLVSSLLSALLVLLGVLAIRRSRARALRLFRASILVSIFLTQLFMFYRQQWAALVVLAFNLVVLAGLRFMIERESDEVASRRRPNGM